jgi:hypothetical protein
MSSNSRFGPDGTEAIGPRGDGLARAPRFFLCEIARQVYRWRRANSGIEARVSRLRKQVGALPKTGTGVPTRDLNPDLDERLAAVRQMDRELVIGDFDQDGAILPRTSGVSGVPVISPEQFMPRSGAKILLVDLNGKLGVRKQFGSDAGRFTQELEALLHLGGCRCPVPRILNVDWDEHWITTTFVPGHVVRELLATAGASIRDRDLDAPLSKSAQSKRVREGREYVARVMSEKQVAAIAAGLHAIHSAGFVLEDVKFGNIILDATSGEPVFIDLERALPIHSLPARLAEYLKEVDFRKFRDHFGAFAVAKSAN